MRFFSVSRFAAICNITHGRLYSSVGKWRCSGPGVVLKGALLLTSERGNRTMDISSMLEVQVKEETDVKENGKRDIKERAAVMSDSCTHGINLTSSHSNLSNYLLGIHSWFFSDTRR